MPVESLQPEDEDDNRALALPDFVALESAQSQENLRIIAERQTRLEELELALQDFCKETATTVSTSVQASHDPVFESREDSPKPAQSRKVSLGSNERLHWHSSKRTYYYEPVTPPPLQQQRSSQIPTAAGDQLSLHQQILSPELLDQFDREYSLCMEALPPQHTIMPPPLPGGPDLAWKSVTVKMYRLPTTTAGSTTEDLNEDEETERIHDSIIIPPRRHLLRDVGYISPSIAPPDTRNFTSIIPVPPTPAEVPRPIPPARRSSILTVTSTATSITLAPVPSSQQLLPNRRSRVPLTLRIPPPPTTEPPSRLARMGVLDPAPRPAAQPKTLGNRWGDPTNVTSFVTPHHVTPAKLGSLETLSSPTLVTTSWRGRAVPLAELWREMDEHQETVDGLGEQKSYVPGWGSLRSAVQIRGSRNKRRPDLSAVFSSSAPAAATTDGSWTATVYPSPPSSPPRRRASKHGGSVRTTAGLASLARKMGKVMRTFETPASIERPAPDLTEPTRQDRTSDMERFRTMLLSTYGTEK
ncbi:hypothetical protein HKX48_000489 [Thoreauomyces humboldtii]|nr:hypothetical protein HKX48_000489 [Thoreauomyces humboldtii]